MTHIDDNTTIPRLDEMIFMFARRFLAQFALCTILVLGWNSHSAIAKTLELVALGDSLTAGYGLNASDAFPVKLQAALKAKGYDVNLVNAGLSGDTASGGLERLDWSVPTGVDGVIVALGANDMLRAQSPERAKQALQEIITTLQQRGTKVMLIGMRAAPNLGADYAARFDAIYPDLAAKYDLVLMPFMLEGVAADPSLNQADGLHPTPEGVDLMVQNALPYVEDFLKTLLVDQTTATPMK